VEKQKKRTRSKEAAKINHYVQTPTSSAAGQLPWQGDWDKLSKGENKGSCG